MPTNKKLATNRKSLNDKKNTLSKLLNLFNLGVDKEKNLKPIKRIRTPEGQLIQFQSFTSSVQKLLNYWMTQCHDNAASWENRKLLYQDIDLVFNGSPLIARAIKLTAQEAIQADSNMKGVDVEAVPKVRDFILEFFEDIELEDQLLPTAMAIVKYGNAGWALSCSDFGVEEILPIDIYDLIDRVEFTPHEVRKQLQDYNSSVMYKLNQHQKMKMLIDSIVSKEDYSSYFKSYLFGFQVGDFILPPWKFLHFRNYTTESPFYPFGMPLFIHAIAPYRQYDAAFTLQMAARAAKFPIQNYKLNLPGNMKITEKIKEATEFMIELENSGMHAIQKQELGVGERIITMADSWEFELINPEFDLGRLDDIEMLRDDLIIATGLPRSFLDPNSTGFGNSGVSLVQQFKPFAREVFNIQTILLQQISQMVKIHMILSGKFKEEEIDFLLTMPYPESQTDREMIGAQTDLLTLANSVLDSVATRIVGDQNAILPPELVKHVYAKLLPYDTSTIDLWVKDALLSKQEKEEGTGEESAGGVGENAAPGGTAPAAGGEGEETTGENINFGGEEETPAPEENAPAAAPATNKESVEKKKKIIKEQNKFNSYFETRKVLRAIKPAKLKESIDIILFEQMQKSGNMNLPVIRGKHYLSSKKKSLDFDTKKLWEFKDKKVELLQERFVSEGFEFEVKNEIISEDEEFELNELLKKTEAKDDYLDSIKLDDIENEVKLNGAE